MATWVIEESAFEHGDARLIAAAKFADHRVIVWDDYSDASRLVHDGHVIFHGSLGVASRAATEFGWTPGSWCNVDGFDLRLVQEQLHPWALNTQGTLSTVGRVLAGTWTGPAFVKPTSAGKPFAGRVFYEKPTAMDMGLGFYHDDPETPVIVSDLQVVGPESRFVVVDRCVVAGSRYDPTTRSSVIAGHSNCRDFADAVALKFDAPDAVYVMDVCETPAGFRVVEVNPFGGADLYACPGESIVAAIDDLLDDDY